MFVPRVTATTQWSLAESHNLSVSSFKHLCTREKETSRFLSGINILWLRDLIRGFMAQNSSVAWSIKIKIKKIDSPSPVTCSLLVINSIHYFKSADIILGLPTPRNSCAMLQGARRSHGSRVCCHYRKLIERNCQICTRSPTWQKQTFKGLPERGRWVGVDSGCFLLPQEAQVLQSMLLFKSLQDV